MILVFDIGTTRLKAALFDEDGISKKQLKIPVYVKSAKDGSHMTDPREWSVGLKYLCKEFSDLSQVRGVVVSGNGPTLTPVFDNVAASGGILHAPAAPALLWMDRRAVAEAEEISKAIGSFIDASFLLPKALFLKRNYQKIYDKSRLFLSSYEYLTYLLTEEAKAVLHAEDGQRWFWSEKHLSLFDLDQRKFPPFCLPGNVVGKTTPLSSRVLGLPHGIPVFAGGPDFIVSILGVGAVTPGRVCNRVGTSEGVNLCTDKVQDDESLMTYRHPVKPYHNVSGIISTSGKAIEWAKTLLGMDGHSFNDFFCLAEKAHPGAGGIVFLPYLAGERTPLWRPDVRAVLRGISISSKREEVARSIVEGVFLALRDVLAVMEKRGYDIDQLRVSGNTFANDFVCQLKADITGKEILLPAVEDAELFGGFIIGKYGLGDYATLAEAAEHLVKTGLLFSPRKECSNLYDDMFGLYRETSRRLYP